MDLTTALGLVAGALTTMSLVPQVVKIWRTESARDVSAGMFATFSSGVAMWLAYGILKDDLPVIIANAGALGLALAVVILKYKYRAAKS